MAKCKVKKTVTSVTLEVDVEEFMTLLIGVGRMSDFDLEKEWKGRDYNGSPSEKLLARLWKSLVEVESEILDAKEGV